MEYKTCGKCKVVKPLTDFFAHKRDGHQSYCKTCAYRAIKAWSKTPRGKHHSRMMSRRYREKAEHKLQLQARHRANYMVELGVIERQPCAVCGDVNAELHHPNYNESGLVIWLCEAHHKNLHKEAISNV